MNNVEQDYNKILTLIKKSNKTVVFLSDEISRKSGVPDYKLPHGKFDEKWQGIDNSRLLTFDFLLANTSLFYQWSKDVWFIMHKYQINKVHSFVKKLQDNNLINKVYTESIDNLCTKAKIKDVEELNGNLSASCLKCGKLFPYETISNFVNKDVVPFCDRCGTLLKPSVLLDEEKINPLLLKKWESDFKSSNLCIFFGEPSTREEYNSFLKLINPEKLVIISDNNFSIETSAYLKIEGIDDCIDFLSLNI